MNYLKALTSKLNFEIFGSKGRLADIKNETALIIQDDLDKLYCDELINKYEYLISKNLGNIWSDKNNSDVRIYDCLKDDQIIEKLKIEEKIGDVQNYIGRKINCSFLMMNKVSYQENNIGSGGGIHRDSLYSNQIKFIWYLNDVTMENGPFQYEKGTNNDQIWKLGKTRRDKFNREPQTVLGKAGTLSIVDTKCLHRGKPLCSGVRYAITLYTSPNPNALNNHLKKLGLI